jgi:hypothetical protein
MQQNSKTRSSNRTFESMYTASLIRRAADMLDLLWLLLLLLLLYLLLLLLLGTMQQQHPKSNPPWCLASCPSCRDPHSGSCRSSSSGSGSSSSSSSSSG